MRPADARRAAMPPPFPVRVVNSPFFGLRRRKAAGGDARRLEASLAPAAQVLTGARSEIEALASLPNG